MRDFISDMTTFISLKAHLKMILYSLLSCAVECKTKKSEFTKRRNVKKFVFTNFLTLLISNREREKEWKAPFTCGFMLQEWDALGNWKWILRLFGQIYLNCEARVKILRKVKHKVRVIAHYILLLNNANGKDSWDFYQKWFTI